MEKFKIFDARLKHPFTAIVAGPSQSGKSTFVIKLLQLSDTYIDKPIHYIVWFYGENTPDINNIATVLPSKHVTTFQGIPDNFDPFIDSLKNGLFVFDDLMSESSKNPLISELATRGVHHRNISVILILQNLFVQGKERTTFMRNSHYLVIFRNPMDYSIPRLLANKLLPRQQDTFLKIYEKAVTSGSRYLFIDGHQETPPEARFRTNILGKYQTVFTPLQNPLWENQ
jgi:hypothetical protein